MIKNKMAGTWRSLVAHTLGVRVVGGSNPLVPTINFSEFIFPGSEIKEKDISNF